MLNRLHFIVVGFGLCILFALGCNRPSTTSVAPPTTGEHEGNDRAKDSHVASALASLSAEDRAAVEKQELCPVGDEPLGEMGTPIKVSVNGRDVFLCWEGCKDTLLGNPDEFLKKLPQE
jgi:Cu(I)/Ag(I) efflux system membrane fusion protein